MPGRIRSVKPELWLHERLAELPLEARYAFIGLFCHADREGRFEWRPGRLKALIYPYESLERDFADLLELLRAGGFITRYSVDGKVYGYFPGWKRHQVINNRERESDLPSPEHADPEPLPPHSEEERGSGSGKGTGRTRADVGPDASATREPRVSGASTTRQADLLVVDDVSFTTNDGKEWRAPRHLYDAWTSAYPAVDVLGEMKKAAAWLLANPRNRKTRDGMPRFLQSWLGRTQNRAPTRPGSTPAQATSRYTPPTLDLGDD